MQRKNLIQGQLAPNRLRTQPAQAKEILIRDPLAPAKGFLIQGQLAPNRPRTQPSQAEQIVIQDPLAPAKEIHIAGAEFNPGRNHQTVLGTITG